jgi:hypothetical protein
MPWMSCNPQHMWQMAVCGMAVQHRALQPLGLTVTLNPCLWQTVPVALLIA